MKKETYPKIGQRVVIGDSTYKVVYINEGKKRVTLEKVSENVTLEVHTGQIRPVVKF